MKNISRNKPINEALGLVYVFIAAAQVVDKYKTPQELTDEQIIDAVRDNFPNANPDPDELRPWIQDIWEKTSEDGESLEEAVTPEEKEINDRVSAILRKSPSKLTKSDIKYLKSVGIDIEDYHSLNDLRISWGIADNQSWWHNPIGKLRSDKENPERKELNRKLDHSFYIDDYDDEYADEILSVVSHSDKDEIDNLIRQYNDADKVPYQGPPADHEKQEQVYKDWRSYPSSWRNKYKSYIYADRQAQAKDMYEPLAKAKKLSVLKKMAGYETPLDRARKDILGRKIGESLEESYKERKDRLKREEDTKPSKLLESLVNKED